MTWRIEDLLLRAGRWPAPLRSASWWLWRTVSGAGRRAEHVTVAEPDSGTRKGDAA
jgi:hypothetical protein